MTDGDRALDFDAVSRELAALGIHRVDGEPFTERQVRRLADDHKLPFFKAPHGRRLIMRSALMETVAAWQVNARREMSNARAEVERARRPKGRA
ncbi:MAG: hypothetical protein J0I54_20480 [Bosea sp.]|uniref:hypothetical protein n=1 Tax=unclassified Bosea (in: a-proteobacteria) TaxID=2653178 RepID=UPI00095BABB7|nr:MULTISPECIES: hypothetical protein [unclassified Bosea (in: a-proteobacteria)]MBN9459016.1 hypothetical protein [Bosea sp. (in: a-proteobacteria)]OJV06241.1 MAG: hypothetical protein BGO20_08265 [Bosea sp. 67-29]